MTFRAVLTRLAPIIVFLFLAGISENLGLLVSAQNWINKERMTFAPRKATGNFAFIAIDKKSLDDVGVWPWPRSIYGKLVDKLIASDVNDIAFDIDFSSHSTPTEDASFAAALERAGGSVILAAFRQASEINTSHDITSVNSPIPELASRAWISTVNVVPDPDGLVRHFPYGGMIESKVVASIPATLSRQDTASTNSFIIDFSIDPETVPTFSLIDVLKPDFDISKLAGKSVLVGAYAVELKDFFITPVHGVVSGPMIQLLAAETLSQNRVLSEMSPYYPLGILAVFLIISMGFFRPRNLTTQGVTILAFAGVAEAVGYFVQANSGLIVLTAPVHLTLILLLINRAVEELGLRKWLVRLANVESRNNRYLLQKIISDSSDAIIVLNESLEILELSKTAEGIFSAHLKIGMDASAWLPEELGFAIEKAFQAQKDGLEHVAIRSELMFDDTGNGRSIDYTVTPSKLEIAPDQKSAGKQDYHIVTITARDITVEREQRLRLDFVSRHDMLTGALRQNEFVRILDSVQTKTPPPGKCFSVFTVNLHRFKTINSTLGRDIGDELLKETVQRLSNMNMPVLAVARMGGDTFAVLPSSPLSIPEMEPVAKVIIELMERPFQLSNVNAKVGARVGIAYSDAENLVSSITLVNNSEFALDQARMISGSGFAFFDSSSNSKILKARNIEQDLWRALDNGEIAVVYQPQVQLDNLELVGVEALIRWNHPKLGFISPMDFVEIAEANGFVENLGRWILDKSCLDAMRWSKPITVAVNVSGLQFTRGDIVEEVKAALARSKLPSERLHLEITESAFLNPSGNLIDKLHQLKALGVSLALDDFGTGYSSFGYLSKFPLDKIKVDQMFVRNLLKENSARAIVNSVKTLTDGLDITMICEGIEFPAELDFLRALDCEQGQGYLFGKPQTWDDIENYKPVVIP